MKFTIFTPFFNYLDAAEDLYNSVINQTYDNWEWLVTDDFSDTKDVKKKLTEFTKKDSRVKLIKSKWKMQYYWNLPIEHSTGDVILKIDSDDIPSLKLLEVYKYNYEKFPDVVSIGCTSIMKKDTHLGYVSGAKYINYKNTSNFLESNNLGVMSVIGDARSYRIKSMKNNGIFIREDEYRPARGEDPHKTLLVEEWGKFFAIPRILHYYTLRDNSNSGGLTVHSETTQEENRKQTLFFDKTHAEAELRVDRRKLFSIEKYYDSAFDHEKNFFFTEMDLETTKTKIEYWSKNVSIEDQLKINELYYDHDIIYNEKTQNPKHIVIDGNTDFESVKSALLDRQLTDCMITITTSNEKRDEMGDLIKSIGYGYWFNIFYYTTFRIKT